MWCLNQKIHSASIHHEFIAPPKLTFLVSVYFHTNRRWCCSLWLHSVKSSVSVGCCSFLDRSRACFKMLTGFWSTTFFLGMIKITRHGTKRFRAAAYCLVASRHLKPQSQQANMGFKMQQVYSHAAVVKAKRARDNWQMH